MPKLDPRVNFCCYDEFLFLSVCDHEVGVSDYSPDQFQASSSLDVNHDADKARLHKSTAWVARYFLYMQS